ncbi:MAG: DUF4381 domain-containing protein [Casimicrobiaceae bacterium]
MNPVAQSALQLRDIHAPGAAPFWPPAPGWWLVAIALAALLAWGVVIAWRRHRVRRQRTRILTVLTDLERDLDRGPTSEMLARVSILLRRLALMRFPRQRVAALTGNAWLDFLDESVEGERFRRGPGRVLAQGPYQRTLPTNLDASGLVALVREWVRKNTGA